MRWSPRVTVAAVITNQHGHHLLVEEAPDGQLVFNQPAGHLENGESLLQAVVREVREETCRAFTPQALVGIYRWIAPNRDTYLRFCFAGSVGEPLADCRIDPDIRAVHWVEAGHIRSGEYAARSPLVLQCIDDHRNGRRYPLELLNEIA